MAKQILSENAATVLAHLQANQGTMETYIDVAAGTGIPGKSVNGVLNGLQRKGYVTREEVEGLEKKAVRLTSEGMAADPFAVAEDDE